MKRRLAIALPLLVLVVSGVVAYALMETAPVAERRERPVSQPTVEVFPVTPSSYRVDIVTRGTVSPRTQSTLVPGVPGRITEVAAEFRGGGFFEENQLLIRLDPRDYENAVTVARSELAQAQLRLSEERAQAAQARRDWDKLGEGEEPTPLALRRPQVASARAAVDAAKARLRQTQIDLERTLIRAPYAGRVLDKSADVGQYVTVGTPLATIYAVDYVEIRLPITDEQLAFLELPEQYRGVEASGSEGLPVTLTARVGRLEHRWQGRIVRSEGAIDTRSRQLFVIAQVDDPYARRDDQPPLKVGQFVEARIDGTELQDVFVLPRAALRGEREVYVVTSESRLERRRLDVVWSDADNVVVAEGLAAGDRISLTALPFAADGVLVRVKGEESTGQARGPGESS